MVFIYLLTYNLMEAITLAGFKKIEHINNIKYNINVTVK